MSHNVWRRRERVARTVSAVLLAMTITACTPTTPTDQSTNSPSPADKVPVFLDTAKMRLPLDAYLPTVEEADQRSAAHRELIRRCMQRFGIEIAIPEPPTGLGLTSRNERRYGLTEPVAAAKLGYGLGERTPTRSPATAERRQP